MKTLNLQQRELYRQVCGLMLPASDLMPDASKLNLQESPVDRALKLRPELFDDMSRLLDKLVTPVSTYQLRQIHKKFPGETKTMKLLICATYYQHQDVKKALSYPGQEALILPRSGFGCEELVLKMMSRTKRYRDIL